MKRIAFLFLTGLLTFQGFSQEEVQDKPKLVVGIVVDQMRYDYLTRFWDRFGENGFKKLVNEGFNFKNNHFNYVPTYTGPGHASVYTGTSPMNHGIIGNGWYNKFIHESVYCVGDASVNPVGTRDDAGQMSPHRLKTTTFADENRLHTQMRGKTIGVALKDRGSILPAGHTANAAYWFHGGDEGKWISSSFYMEDLPQWVKDFNDSDKVEAYLKTWNTLYDINTYHESGSDLNEFEGGYRGKETATFPYDLTKLGDTDRKYEILKSSAYGNDITTDFALAAIDAEDLGRDDITDVLTLSYSSTDYIGHNFGVNSKEVQDAYLRLDQNIAEVLKQLDEKVGKGNYTVFLTADHGGVDVPAYLKSVNIPAGYFESDEFTKALKEFTLKEFEVENLIESVYNSQVFFNYEVMEQTGINFSELQSKVAHYILQLDQIDKVFTRDQLSSGSFVTGAGSAIQNGFNQKRSGDVVYVLDPATIVYSKTGSTHGSGLMYDTHAPLIFYGNGVKHGSTTKRTEIIDIAPTVSAILGISFPNGTTGTPLHMLLEKGESEISE
ncbi:type I phosphodiesterase/nucleotide pyrophosphatase [Salegentibacter sp. 24]|uniref:alkaline phosphatase PafA n=1 Tax=Salegentibacter sp. 24 TaxID=2183986 RepID=UPI0010619E5D|nr:alkaline phosphatase PafA [Salegentibacter sp. 24]TDN93450.1 type I phosphodiesterase/nucleotide pyrophosphatase [Salegentibacter sp. 24]